MIETKRTELVLSFSPEAYSRLETMVKQSGAANRANVVINALRLYEWYLRETSNGYKIRLHKEGEETEREVEFKF